MTEITNYRCDICGEIYLNQADANKCEAFHIRPSSVETMTFNSITKTNIPYPAFLAVRTNDNALVKYVYHELLNAPQPDSDNGGDDVSEDGGDEQTEDDGEEENA